MDELEALGPDYSTFGGPPPPPLPPHPPHPPSTPGDAGQKPPRFSRRTKIGAAALAVVMVGAGGWEAGRSIHSGSTVRVQPASATGRSGGSTSTANGPGRRLGGIASAILGRGVLGTVTGTPGSTAFVVTPTALGGRTLPSGASGGTTQSPVTVDVSSSTTYSQVQAATGLVTDLPSGTDIIAAGTRNSDGSLQAALVAFAPSALPGTNRPAGGQPSPAAGSASQTAQAPFAIGTVTSDTSAGVITVKTSGGAGETIHTSSTTRGLRDVSTTYASVINGTQVLVQAPRPATSNGAAQPSSNAPIHASHVTVIPLGSIANGFGMFGAGFGG